jgi:hypothetical protein
MHQQIFMNHRWKIFNEHSVRLLTAAVIRRQKREYQTIAVAPFVWENLVCAVFHVGCRVLFHVVFSSAFIVSHRIWRRHFYRHHLSPLFSSRVHHRMVIETNVVSLLPTVYHEDSRDSHPRTRGNRRTWAFLAISISRPGYGSCLLFIHFLTRVVMMRYTDNCNTPSTACCNV